MYEQKSYTAKKVTSYMSGTISCLLLDDRSSSNAVFNMDGADDEGDPKHEYLEIVESNGQAQGNASCF